MTSPMVRARRSPVQMPTTPSRATVRIVLTKNFARAARFGAYRSGRRWDTTGPQTHVAGLVARHGTWPDARPPPWWACKGADEIGSQRRPTVFFMMIVVIAALACVVLVVAASITTIGPTEVGLVTKRFSLKKLGDDNPIAFHGEAGYQAELLMPGLRFKLWPIFGVKKFPWVQVPAGEIGVVIAQVGAPLPIGAKSGVYKPEFGNFSDARDVRRRAAGRRACSGRCSRRARCCRSTRSRSSSSRRARSTACRCRPSSSSACEGDRRRAARRVVRAHARAAAGRRDRAASVRRT